MPESSYIVAVMLVGGFLALGGCDIAGTASQASVRVVNASMDYAAVDMYLDDTRRLSSVGYETGSSYVKVDAESYTAEFTRADAFRRWTPSSRSSMRTAATPSSPWDPVVPSRCLYWTRRLTRRRRARP